MLIAFTLTMPNVGSWNGKWTGADNLYCIIRSFNGKAKRAKGAELLEAGSWYYGWNDGWGASISAKLVDGRKAAQLRKKSRGFCGYDWMVDAIIEYGKPLARHEVKAHLEKKGGDA